MVSSVEKFIGSEKQITTLSILVLQCPGNIITEFKSDSIIFVGDTRLDKNGLFPEMHGSEIDFDVDRKCFWCDTVVESRIRVDVGNVGNFNRV